MLTALPARREADLTWRQTARLLRLTWRARRRARRMAAEHRRIDRLGPEAASDGLLRTARAWVACHAEIAVLLGLPELPEVGQVRRAVGISPRR